MICECGGNLVPARLANYDFSRAVGKPVAPLTNVTVDGYRCDKCADETPTGDAINMFVAGFYSGTLAPSVDSKRQAFTLDLKYIPKVRTLLDQHARLLTVLKEATSILEVLTATPDRPMPRQLSLCEALGSVHASRALIAEIEKP